MHHARRPGCSARRARPGNSACSRWACSASAVTTAPARSRPVQQRREHGDLVGLAVHGDLGEDRAGAVVQAGQQVRRLPRRWRAGRRAGSCRPPPAPRRRPGARRAAAAAVTHDPEPRSRAAGSTAVSTRQIVTRSGTGPGSPSPARSCGGASLAHSAIAAYDRAPARVAHTATARTGTRSVPHPARVPRIRAPAPARPAARPARAPRGRQSRRARASSWPAARTVGEDDTAGTAPGDDHEVSTTS